MRATQVNAKNNSLMGEVWQLSGPSLRAQALANDQNAGEISRRWPLLCRYKILSLPSLSTIIHSSLLSSLISKTRLSSLFSLSKAVQDPQAPASLDTAGEPPRRKLVVGEVPRLKTGLPWSGSRTAGGTVGGAT